MNQVNNDAAAEQPTLVFLSKAQVLKKIPVTAPTLWAWVRAGKFPVRAPFLQTKPYGSQRRWTRGCRRVRIVNTNPLPEETTMGYKNEKTPAGEMTGVNGVSDGGALNCQHTTVIGGAGKAKVRLND